MANGDKSASVSRAEFNTALTVIWMYITLTISNQLPNDGRWSIKILFLGALGMTIYQIVCMFRDRPQREA